MALDHFICAETRAAYIAWLTRAQVRAIIGDLRARDEDGSVSSPAALQGIAGSVDLVQWDVNQIVVVPAVLDEDGEIITPAVMDPMAWIQVRLTGVAEAADKIGQPAEDEIDYWERSRMVKLMAAGQGREDVYRNVQSFRNKAGSNKIIHQCRGSDLQAKIHFHEFMGGNSY